jgi:translation elongation factor EF-Tu-like GTPase
VKKNKLTISYLPGADVIVLNQDDGVFISTKDSVIIGKNALIAIVVYLIDSGIVVKEELLKELEHDN